MLDGTVNNRVFTWMKNFVRNYARQLPVDSGQYRVGAMTYTNRPNGQFQLNQYNTQNEVSITAYPGLFPRFSVLFCVLLFFFLVEKNSSVSGGVGPNL